MVGYKDLSGDITVLVYCALVWYIKQPLPSDTKSLHRIFFWLLTNRPFNLFVSQQCGV